MHGMFVGMLSRYRTLFPYKIDPINVIIEMSRVEVTVMKMKIENVS